MSIRTFWHLIIKTMGIWIFIQGLISFPGFVMTLIVAYGSPYRDNTVFITTEILMFLVPVVFFILVLRYLVIKTNRIIDLLRLEKGMEETRLDLSIPFEKLLRIGIILIGGITAVSSLPDLFKNSYLYLFADYAIKNNPTGLFVVTYAIQFTIGFLIMTNSDVVLSYIHKRSGESETKQLDQEDF